MLNEAIKFLLVHLHFELYTHTVRTPYGIHVDLMTPRRHPGTSARPSMRFSENDPGASWSPPIFSCDLFMRISMNTGKASQ
jgi:hypothetical protein